MLDASRAVPVTTSLLSDEGKPAFVAQHRAEYEALRKTHAAPRQKVVSLETARAGGLRSSGVPKISCTGFYRRARAGQLSLWRSCASSSTGRRSSTPGD